MSKRSSNGYWKDHLYAEQKGICAYCGKKCFLAQFNVDHIIPRAKGGGNERSNLIGVCVGCNQEKGARLVWRLQSVSK